MQSSTHIIIFIIVRVVLLVLVHTYKKWRSYTAFRAAVAEHGCERPSKYPHKEPFWGLDLLNKRRKAIKEGRQREFYMNLANTYGKTWEEKTITFKTINTMESRNIQRVAAFAFQDYSRIFRKFEHRFLGRGIISGEGVAWKRARNMVKPIFSRSELSDVESFRFHVDRFLNLIPRDGSTVDMQPYLHKLFLDSSSDFLFGKSMDSQLSNDPNGSAGFLRAFNASLVGLGKRRLVGRLSHILFAFDKDWKKSVKRVHDYIDFHVMRALEETSNAKDKPQSRYIFLHELAKQTRDPIELRSQVLQVFMPGKDTISILMSNMLFHLARNPDVWIQVRAETMALGDTPLTFEVLRSLKLCKQVINETLRLQGPSGRIRRIAIRNTILPVGGGPDGKAPVFVEKGTIVALDLYGLAHDKDIWGDDINEFKPQRWESKRPMWDFVPFFGGPRICPAQQQVLTQATYLLARMTRELARIENRDPVMMYVEGRKMTSESRNGVQVALFPANG